MPSLHRECLEGLCYSIVGSESEFQSWRRLIDIRGGSIADFGCSTGHETLALMWLLEAAEAVGVDKNRKSIEQANEEISQCLEEANASLSYLSQDNWQWLTQLTEKFPFVQPTAMRVPAFVEADFTKTVDGLFSNHFDLAYCSNVLYHILGESRQRGLTNALREMQRVIKDERWVIVSEPPDVDIDLGNAAQNLGLRRIKTERITDDKTVYIFQKSAPS